MGDFVICVRALELVQVLVLSNEPVEKRAHSTHSHHVALMLVWQNSLAGMFSADRGRDLLALQQSLSIPFPFRQGMSLGLSL